MSVVASCGTPKVLSKKKGEKWETAYVRPAGFLVYKESIKNKARGTSGRRKKTS